jgi:hypothetical protein
MLKFALIAVAVVLVGYFLVVLVLSVIDTVREVRASTREPIKKDINASASFGGALSAKLIRKGEVIQHEKA